MPMFCVSPIFYERELHLLNHEVSDFFDGDFIRVSKVIVNICAIVAFMIPQHEIANFYWFIYLIRTFTENALPNLTDKFQSPDITFNIPVKCFIITRKATDFKSLRVNCWEINMVTSKCQMDFWTNLQKMSKIEKSKITIKFYIFQII